ncbi:hypothetical protein L2E82_51170 [Cichorium intybus]|nr:hypothetical protein L2E82_51170 [Cichorium intybus]
MGTREKPVQLKVYVDKKKTKVMFAEAEEDFVDILFSFFTLPLGIIAKHADSKEIRVGSLTSFFLTIRLGAFLCLTKDDSSSLGITNLYNSISCLGDGKYFRSEDVKNMLLCPKVEGTYYPCVADFLRIYGPNSWPVFFLKEPVTFIVSDNLEVTASSMDTISKLNTLGVPVGDMEVLEVNIGEIEAPLLLKACFSSTSALTDFLNALSEKTYGKLINLKL